MGRKEEGGGGSLSPVVNLHNAAVHIVPFIEHSKGNAHKIKKLEKGKFKCNTTGELHSRPLSRSPLKRHTHQFTVTCSCSTMFMTAHTQNKSVHLQRQSANFSCQITRSMSLYSWRMSIVNCSTLHINNQLLHNVCPYIHYMQFSNSYVSSELESGGMTLYQYYIAPVGLQGHRNRSGRSGGCWTNLRPTNQRKNGRMSFGRLLNSCSKSSYASRDLRKQLSSIRFAMPRSQV